MGIQCVKSKNGRGFQPIPFSTQSKIAKKRLNKKQKTNIMSTLNRKSTRNKSKGLGDTIEQITKATGIEKAVKFIAGDDCGCQERKEKLNKIFPYKKPLCMTESEYEWWGEFRAQNSTNISPMELDMISDIYRRIFQLRNKYRPCTCNPREWQRLINELNAVYNTYE